MKGGGRGGTTTTKSFQGGQWWKHSVFHLCLSVNTYLHMLVHTSCPRPGSLGVEVISVSPVKALKGKSSAREKKKKETALKSDFARCWRLPYKLSADHSGNESNTYRCGAEIDVSTFKSCWVCLPVDFHCTGG